MAWMDRPVPYSGEWEEERILDSELGRTVLDNDNGLLSTVQS